MHGTFGRRANWAKAKDDWAKNQLGSSQLGDLEIVIFSTKVTTSKSNTDPNPDPTFVALAANHYAVARTPNSI